MVSSTKAVAQGDDRCVSLQKLTDLRVSVPVTEILLINSLYDKHGQCPIPNLTLIQLVARNSSLFATYRALTPKYQ